MYPKIYGFNPSSEAGPDNFAPSIFLGGCNFRCHYCMNAKLITDCDSLPEFPIEQLKEFVDENKDFCEWVNISGGEITVNMVDETIHLITEIKRWGCKIAISTNGFEYERLSLLLPYVNYVTMDIKTDKNKYNDIVIPLSRQEYSGFFNVMESLERLRKRKKDDILFNYELRTTLYRPLVGKSEIKEIGSWLKRDERWMLQPFRKARCMIDQEAYQVEPYTVEEMEELSSLSKKYSDNAFIRHV